MIREPETEQFKISVYFKSGKACLDKDTTSKPFGDHMNVVTFWDDDSIHIYPMDQIDHVELIPEVVGESV